MSLRRDSRSSSVRRLHAKTTVRSVARRIAVLASFWHPIAAKFVVDRTWWVVIYRKYRISCTLDESAPKCLSSEPESSPSSGGPAVGPTAFRRTSGLTSRMPPSEPSGRARPILKTTCSCIGEVRQSLGRVGPSPPDRPDSLDRFSTGPIMGV